MSAGSYIGRGALNGYRRYISRFGEVSGGFRYLERGVQPLAQSASENFRVATPTSGT